MTIHELLDFRYGTDGDDVLHRMLGEGADPDVRGGPHRETPLHVATRRRRVTAVDILLKHGADIDARTAGGKTAYAHAIRRGFGEVAELLAERGADTGLNEADRFAVAIVSGDLDEARAILQAHPGVARTGNPEEDRLLADVAGRNHREPVALLVDARADLTATGLDSGAALHQAAWFGQPDNARLLTAMMNGGEYEGYRVLEAGTVDEMLTPQYEEEIAPGVTSDLVWRLNDYGTRRWSFDHAGGHMFGWRTEGFAWPELGVTLMVAHNQWSLPDPSPEGGMITSFVEEWAANAPPDIELTAASEEWAWKVSYVRGAMYAAMFGMYVGVEWDIPADGLEEAIASTRVQPGWRDDWDPDAFREGVRDISEVGLGYAEVTGFWSSEASRVTVEEAEVILTELGARFPGSIAIIFPPARRHRR